MISDLGSQISDPGSRISDRGSRISDLGPRYRISDFGSRISDLASRFSVFDLGSRDTTNYKKRSPHYYKPNVLYLQLGATRPCCFSLAQGDSHKGSQRTLEQWLRALNGLKEHSNKSFESSAASKTTRAMVSGAQWPQITLEQYFGMPNSHSEFPSNLCERSVALKNTREMVTNAQWPQETLDSKDIGLKGHQSQRTFISKHIGPEGY